MLAASQRRQIHTMRYGSGGVRHETGEQGIMALRKILVTACAALLLASCTQSTTVVDGRAVSPLDDPNRAGGLVVADGPSGVRDNAPAPTGDVKGTDNGPVDKLALQSFDDIQEYWRAHFAFGKGEFKEVANLLSYDAKDPDSPKVCGSPTYKEPNAFYCYKQNLMAWDRGMFMPAGIKYFGDISITGVIAHEYGHAVQRMAKAVNMLTTPTIVFEQQADCFAGVYMRYVAEDQSPRFKMSTGDGLNHVLAGLIAIRDPVLTPKDADLLKNGHGTGLDRVTAFQMGFVSGAGACADIDYKEIKKRRGNLPESLLIDESGALDNQAPVNEDTLQTLMEILGQIFHPSKAPTLVFESKECSDAKETPPASYCPATNTITVNLPELQNMGTSADESKKVLVQGNNTALSAVTSRYMLAIQHERNLALNNVETAMRTACLTGVAQRRMADPVKLDSGKSLILSAGDLDQAIAGLLTSGLAASDVNGYVVPAGFTRIIAFRAGLMGDEDQCVKRFQ
ncbi:protein LpqM [Mycobacteroides abscessus subsp. abscessus]|nr:protein LpqM [Mycobacteroides abscessus subsp. abscessus]